MVLPEVSGYDVFHAIRQINADAKILLCSGYGADNEVRKLLGDGITDFVQKPFTITDLSHAMAKLLAVSPPQA
jgi:CheY-like chemotaxis protein